MTTLPGARSRGSAARRLRPRASASTTASSGSQSTSISSSASSAASRRLGHDGGDARAGERDLVDLERARRDDVVLDAGRLPGARQRVQVLEVLPGEDADDAGRRGGARVSIAPIRACAYGERRIATCATPGQLEVVEVARRAGDQPRVLDPLDRAGRSSRGRASRTVSPSPLTSRRAAAARTARTMFS